MNKDNTDVTGWIITILFLIFFPPVGIFLLFRQLMGYNARERRNQSGSNQAGYNRQYEYHYAGDPQKSRQDPPQGQAGTSQNPARSTAKLNLKNGKKLIVGGSVLAALFGLSSVTCLAGLFAAGELGFILPALVPQLGLMAAGLVILYAGLFRSKKEKRFYRYLPLIGRQKQISVTALAKTMGLSERKVLDDLDEMLVRGLLPVGYLDRGNNMLVLTDEGIKSPQKEEAKKADEGRKESSILQEIQEINDAIPDLEMSRKIDRIREITGKILDYQTKNPGKNAELRSFLDYYLPTTLKILRAYAQLDAQGIQGENITSAKIRIEGMMDKVVEGFEKQLDKLFEADSLDIASDVQVLEQMLQKDGLSGGEGMTLEL